jgi:hypothetical protein
LEKAYIDRFNKVAQLDKEKNIKFFQSIGDPTFTEDNERAIMAERDEYKVLFSEILECLEKLS